MDPGGGKRIKERDISLTPPMGTGMRVRGVVSPEEMGGMIEIFPDRSAGMSASRIAGGRTVRDTERRGPMTGGIRVGRSNKIAPGVLNRAIRVTRETKLAPGRRTEVKIRAVTVEARVGRSNKVAPGALHRARRVIREAGVIPARRPGSSTAVRGVPASKRV